MKPILRRILLVPLMMLMGDIAVAQETSVPDDGDEESARLERSLRDAGLTEQQRAAMRSLSENHRAAVQPLREQIRVARQTLANTQPGDPNYDVVTTEARRSLEAARAQLRTQQQQFRSDIQSLLTPEQRAQWEARRAERRQQRQDGGMRDGGMRDGGRSRPGAGGLPRSPPRGTGRGGRSGG